MANRIVLQRLQTPEDVEALYASLLRQGADDEPLEISLSTASFIKPVGVLGLITAARLWHQWTGRSVVLTDVWPPVHAYLERVDVFAECGDFLKITGELAESDELVRSDSSRRLLEVLSIPSEEQANAQAVTDAVRRAEQILSTWLNDAALQGSVLTVLSEIAQNIIHSRDKGFAVIQRYKQSYTLDIEYASEICIGIADLGIGIKESLCEFHPELRDKFQLGSDFIQYAMEPGTSGQLRVRGLGLAHVRDLARKWHGALTIRSFGSTVQSEHDCLEVRDDLTQIPGVQVFITVRGKAAPGNR